MYDWNGNGKHDSFDDAVFMALLDDDLRRHPPKKAVKKKTIADTSFGDMMISVLITSLIGVFFVCVISGYALVGVMLIVIAVLVMVLVVGETSGSASGSGQVQSGPRLTHNEQVRERAKAIEKELYYGKIIKTYDKSFYFQLTERWKKLGDACLYYCNYENEYYIKKVNFAQIAACEVYSSSRVIKRYTKPDFKIPAVEKVPQNGLIIYQDLMREPLIANFKGYEYDLEIV